MRDGMRWWLGAIAPLAGWTLLVADSAPPECGIYRGFDLTYSYATDCFAEPSEGQIHLILADRDRWDWRDEAALIDQAADGGLEVAELQVWRDLSDCDDTDDSVAEVTGLEFWLKSPEGRGPASIRCSHPEGDEWAAGLESDQSFTCALPETAEEPAAECSLTLTYEG